MGLVLHLRVILIVASVGCKGTTENYCFALLDIAIYTIFVANYLVPTKVIVIGSYTGRVVKNGMNRDVHGCEVANASYLSPCSIRPKG